MLRAILPIAVLAAVFLQPVVEATYYCRRPPSVANGRHSGGSSWYFRAGTTITYSCNDGFRLEGNNRITCYYSRSSRSYDWSGTPPTCVSEKLRVDNVRDNSDEDSSSYDSSSDDSSNAWGSVYCPSLSSISNGHVKYYSRRPGAIAKYSCRSGYSLEGSSYRKCLSSGQWTGLQPECKSDQKAECSNLPNPQNGYVKFTEGRGIGAEVWYICNAGYRLDGSESRRCGSDLNWSGDAPQCVAQGCDRPDRPENGWVRYRYTTVGAQAWYFCNHGYTRVGSESRTCKSNGNWEPGLPLCKRAGCGELDSPDNGKVTYTSTSIGSYAIYACNDGFYLKGIMLRKCEASGWSGEAPICKPLACDQLPPLEHGSIKLSNGNRVSSVATYTCDRGYIFKRGFGDITRTCNEDQSWSGSPPLCIPIDCGPLSAPADGSVRITSTRLDATATYSCNDGFILNGVSSRTCLQTGEWSGEAPTCDGQVRCPDLSNPLNGRVNQAGNRPGDRASYFCNRDYHLIGNSPRICQNNGQWSGAVPTCERQNTSNVTTCPDLPNPLNGRISQGGNRPGDRASYFCNHDYQLVGETPRTCQNNGQWSGEAPTCELRVRCPDLPSPLNGRVSQGGNRPGDRASYFCNHDYQLVGETPRTCQQNGQWSGEAPTCELRVRCPDLPSPLNGRVSQGGNRPGDRASYFCNHDYQLVGETPRTCQNNGQWSGEAPTCELRVRCSSLTPPSNGKVDQRGTRPGDRAIYTCNTNYELNGDQTRTCQNNGQWSGVAPTCIRVVCSNLASPANGQVSFSSGLAVGSRATYTCSSGYVLVGEESRTCQADGNWSGRAPICRIIRCGGLSDPSNGRVSISTDTPGGIATYSCNSGYELVGTERRTCQNDGQWSDRAPNCRIIRCGGLSNPLNGQVRITNDIPGGTATYSCNSGYNLNGQITRTCQDNGEWSGEAPICQREILCRDLTPPSNGRVVQRGNRPNDVATYSCITNYVLSGSETRTCQSDGSWSGDAPTCTPIVCSNLPSPANGQVVISSLLVGSRATYTCSSGYVLVGDESRTCQADGNWSGRAPICRIVRCSGLSNPSNGRVSISTDTPGGIATYSCNSGYELVGTERRTCQNNGQWSDRAPTCRIVRCGGLSDPSNGRVIITNDIPGGTATYSCNSGYSLNGQSTRTCQDSGEWSGEAPICQREILCRDLTPPSNGRVVQRGNRPGDVATYSCITNYVLSGSETRTCQSDGSWSGDAPTCTPIVCSNLPSPANGQVVISSLLVGSRATYTCSSGYVLVGEESRTCQADGNWSGRAPTCLIVRCGGLSNPSNGRVRITNDVPGSTATYTCNSGYTLVGGETRTCQNDGTWSGSAPTCTRVVCSNLPSPANGQVSFSSGLAVGSRATYTCSSGYVLVGEESRTCQADGNWSGRAPICRIVRCGGLNDPSNGQVRITNDVPGSTATYTCNSGYTLVGGETRTCQNDGTWSGSAPTCTRVVCSNLPSPANGQVSFSSGLAVGSRATYTCSSGYVLVGEESRTCQADGNWSGRAPICRIVRCGGLNDPSNGQVRITNDVPGSTATYTCNSGYTLVGGETRTCQNDGTWSGSAPTCTRIVCSNLPSPANGQVSFSSGLAVGSRATYTCSSGYVLVGEESRTCRSDGNWSGRAPICRIVRCGGLSDPSNGRVSISTDTPGGIATYTCNSGYALVGTERRSCQNNGQWSGRAPTCRIVRCGGLSDPSNGRVIITNDVPGGTATYSCNSGYNLNGQNTRTCQNNGEWSGEAPICQREILCRDLTPPSNGRVVQRGNRPGDVATYSCITNYVLSGSETRTCQSDGSWSGNAPTCTPTVCSNLPSPANGQVVISSLLIGSRATYTCSSGYVLVGEESRTCQSDGNWSGRAPTCVIVRCGGLSNPSNGQVRIINDVPGSTATYSCNSGYTLVGGETRTCQNDGTWSGSAPTCTRVVCSSLPSPANGQVSFSSGLAVGSRATYTCSSGYVLVGEESRTCRSDGNWSGRAPICRIIRCGGLSDPSNGRVSISTDTPGGIATYSCNSGYELVGTERRTCQNDGQWSDRAPTCRIVRCGGLSNPSNGQVRITNDIPGSTATYRCNSGYSLNGQNTRTCQDSGEWSGEAPICQREILCRDLTPPSNGRVVQRGNRPGDVATYSCITNYVLSGSETRTCQNDGTWSGSAPTCTRVVCSNLASPANGQVSFSSGLAVGSRATYTCSSGYILVGEESRTCRSDGNWSGRAPICRIVRCGGLSDPSNGQVSISTDTPGGIATYSCNSGYELVGTERRTCQNDGQWSGEAPICQREILCRDLTPPSNGRVVQRGNRPGDVATYSCITNYVLSGSETRTCQSDGSWSGNAPICTPTVCSNLPSPANGQVVISSLLIGSRATYTCSSGYVLVGEESRTCQSDGNWSGRAPTCRIVRCGGLSNPSNGQVRITNDVPGSTATYSCNSGYTLVGGETRTCQNDGTWSGSAPTCTRVVCSNLPSPANGQVSFSSGLAVGSRATYTCSSGYVLVGEESRTCQADGNWSGRAPICRIIRCGGLSDPSNGRVSISTDTPGGIATYSCNSGYELVGTERRTCQNDGQWSDRTPTCRIVRCGGLSDPSNGRVSISANIPGGIATYSCNSGYELVGRDTRTCQNDGVWSGIAPMCRRVRCTTLPSISNGQVTFNNDIIFPETVATYSCIAGYALVGGDTRVCQENGQWSGQVPFCRLVECGNLPNPRNGRVDLTGTTFGSSATYSCNNNYMLDGPQTRRCQADGTWSGREPTCERDVFDCGTLEDPENGSVDLSDGTTERSVAVYTCFSGYQLNGVSTRTCSRSGWSDKEPTCEPVDCGPLNSPSVGQVSWTTTFFGGVATYSCFSGYVLDGQSERRCETNGFWSGQPPVCRPVDCGLLQDPTNGRVAFTSTVFRSIATYSCFSGYDIVGVTQRMCTAEGVWSEVPPICQPTTQCPELPPLVNGQVVIPSRDVGSVVTYTCLPGYTTQGNRQRTCQSDGTWSGTPPICILIDICSPLTAPTNGDVLVSGLTLGSQAVYSCDVGYELVGIARRECSVDGIWSGSVPFCRLIDCGRLGSPANGVVDFVRTTFGAMAFYSCNTGYFLQGFTTRTCQANGLWSNSEPTCEREVRCATLENPSNGVVVTTGQMPGSFATYECNLGYDIQGDTTRTCQNSGIWTGVEPTCNPVDCGLLFDPANGQVTVSETTFGGSALYTCNLGYELVGTERRLCTISGQWSDQEPSCRPVVCSVLTDPTNGFVSFTTTTFNSVATYTCTGNYVISGSRQRTCLETGQWSGEEPTCIIPPPSCGDPGLLVNGRRIGDTFSRGSVVFFRCFDDYDIVGSKYRVCQEDGTWSGTQPICTPFNDTCPENAKEIENDRCGRRCQCINGKLVNCCRVRKDYTGLTENERQLYISTFLDMTRDPIYRPRYNTLVKLYKDSFTSNNITQSGVAAESQYFVFNRYFLLEYEDLLKDFECSVTVPFYDWTPFPVAPYTAAVWDNTNGFGDTARAVDNCVITGPVRVGEYEIAPSAGGGCLKREYMNRRFPSRDIINRDVLPYPAEEFAHFHQMLQLLIGLNVQCFVGGTMCSMDAANDPVFLLHLAQLDSILTRWQLFGQGREQVRYTSDTRPLLLTPGFTVSQFSSNLNLPYDNCVVYDPPVLLKNHAAPPSSLQSLAAGAAGAAPAALPREKMMDCAPSNTMEYMNALMSKENHEFMISECEARRPTY